MKSSNLAWRVEPAAENAGDRGCGLPEAHHLPPADAMPALAPRPRPSFERRTIVIRDQGFEPFRVR